jgi:hypothetical protein
MRECGLKQPSKLIVIYSKTSLHFCEDCRIFCEGEWEQQRQLDGYTDLIGFGLIDLFSLVDQVDLIVGIGLIAIKWRLNDFNGTHLTKKNPDAPT